MSATTDLRGALAELGMPGAFVPKQADFSLINGAAPPDERALYLSRVLHQAFIETNEAGTEAAAATLAAMLVLGLPESRRPVIFRADHPFLFAIQDRPSGAILFIGRVQDPRGT